MSWKPSGLPSVSTSVVGLRLGAPWKPAVSKPGSACQMIITPAEPCAFASANVCCSHSSSAASRAVYSGTSPPGSPVPLEQRLLQLPCTVSVADVAVWNVQRPFSTQPVKVRGWPVRLVVPWQSGAVCSSSSIVCWPNDRLSEKKTLRSYCSRSSELKPPFEVRSQSVQSLSPGVKIAGSRSESKYPSPCE